MFDIPFVGFAIGGNCLDNDLVCPGEDGSLWVPSAFTSGFRDLLRRRKLTGPTLHALRHSHASQLLKAGLNVKLVSERLGHDKASFTLDQYVHLLPGRDEEAARWIDTTLRAAIEKQRRPMAQCAPATFWISAAVVKAPSVLAVPSV